MIRLLDGSIVGWMKGKRAKSKSNN